MLVLDDVARAALARVPRAALVPAPAHARTRCGSCSPRAPIRRCRCTCCACAAGSSRSAAADLAFTEDETAELLAAHGLELSERPGARAAHPHRGLGRGPAARRAEPAGPRGSGGASSPSSPATTASSATTCWPRSSTASRARLRAFLLRTSLVERICGSLADALTGDRHGADTLADARAHQRIRARRRRPRRVVPLPPPVREAAAHARRARARRASCRGCTPARRAGTRSRAPASTRSSTRWPPATGTSPSRSSPSTGSSSTCAATRPRSARSSPRCRAERLRDRRRAGRRARLRGARRRRHRRGGAPPRARRAPRPRACPTPRRRRYLETMALARLATARLRRRLRGRDRGRRRAARRGRGARRRLRRRAPGARARDARRGRAVGRTGSTARARSSRKAVTLARAERGSTTSRSSALSDLSLLDVMIAGPARRPGSRARGDRARGAARLADDPADDLRAHGARARRVLRPAAGRGRGASGARRARSPPRSACARWTS